MRYGSNCTVEVPVEDYMMNLTSLPVPMGVGKILYQHVLLGKVSSAWFRSHAWHTEEFWLLRVVFISLQCWYHPKHTKTRNYPQVSLTGDNDIASQGPPWIRRTFAIYLPTFVVPLVLTLDEIDVDVAFTITHHALNCWNYAHYLSERYIEMSWSWV